MGLTGQMALGLILTPALADWTVAPVACAAALAACIVAVVRAPLAASVSGGGAFALWITLVTRAAWREGDCEPMYTVIPVFAAGCAGLFFFVLALAGARAARRASR
jgi:hypothetical protein